jgi:hypothetical protein
MLVATIGAVLGNHVPYSSLDTNGVEVTGILVYGGAGLGLLLGWLVAPLLVRILELPIRWDPPKVKNPEGHAADATGVLLVLGLGSLYFLYRELTSANTETGLLIFGVIIANAIGWSIIGLARTSKGPS